MNFAESTRYLYSLGNEVSAMKLGLENIRKLLYALGDPQNNYLKVQVAGTNGKGSVCAFLDSISVRAGINTGLYTSPHLISITERIKIGGKDISEDDFARDATNVRETAESLLQRGEIEYRPTFFEQLTAIALAAFAEAKVDLAILETGLGGRLDATTAATAEIAAITQIDIDHQEYLGETLAEIATEKAAIIHAGSTVVVAKQKSVPKKVIQDRLEALGLDGRFAERVSITCGSGWLKFGTDKDEYEIKSLGLLGGHQTENTKVAILLAETLQQHFVISRQNIIDGLENARHPGRLEFQGKYLFDGAHNVAGAKALRAYLDDFVPQPITLVFGAMKDKNVDEIIEILLPKAGSLILTRPNNERAVTAKQIAECVPENYGHDRVFLTERVDDAIKKADEITGKDRVILVTGSLYLVGEVKKILNN